MRHLSSGLGSSHALPRRQLLQRGWKLLPLPADSHIHLLLRSASSGGRSQAGCIAGRAQLALCTVLRSSPTMIREGPRPR